MSVDLTGIGEEISLLEEKKLLRAMFYGDPGAGKTTLACHLVRNRGALVSSDSAWVVLHKYPEVAKKIVRYPFGNFRQVRAIVKGHREGIEPYRTYDTLVWDTASTAIQIMLRGAVDANKFATQQIHPSVEAWAHYRIIERALVETIEELNRSDLNIIYLAHVKDPSEADKEKQRFYIRPNMPEACFRAIHQETQVLGWLHKENQSGKRQIQLAGTMKVAAKSQISTLPEATYTTQEVITNLQEWMSS